MDTERWRREILEPLLEDRKPTADTDRTQDYVFESTRLPAGWEDLVEPTVRDGVAIDRDKGTAADKQKFTYEVVSPETPFDLEIILENASDVELGMAWLGLMGFQQGQIPFGLGR